MIKYLSLFSGIGAFEKALDNIGVKYELVNYCEVDKYASKAYSLIHNVPESMNLGDITKVDETKLPTEIDLMTYGFPCQDISSAGLQKGLRNEDGSKTRSGLFFDAIRIMKHCKPRIAIAENVKNLTSKRMSGVFDTVLQIADLHYYNMDMPNRIYSPEGISPTLKTVSGGGGEVKVLKNKLYRKLTPKEYFRLMGFSDSDYQILVDNGISKSQLYKMAGNSIVVTVLENLFKQIYKPVTQSIASLKQQSLDILNNI